jgi:hypothetical protein
MSGAVPPLPRYAFMEWCSVEAQGQLTLKVVFYGIPFEGVVSITFLIHTYLHGIFIALKYS